MPGLWLTAHCLALWHSPGGVPGGILQHCILDDRPASRDQPLPALLSPGHCHSLGGPVFGTANWSCLQLSTGGKADRWGPLRGEEAGMI